MSSVTYMIGNEVLGFETELQYTSEEDEFKLGEKLLVEIKEHLSHVKSYLQKGYIHDVVFKDNNGIIAKAKNFKDINTLKKIEK